MKTAATDGSTKNAVNGGWKWQIIEKQKQKQNKNKKKLKQKYGK